MHTNINNVTINSTPTTIIPQPTTRLDHCLMSHFHQLLGSETARATLLFSMEQGVIQGWVGLDPVEEGVVAARLKEVSQLGVQQG